MAEIQASVDLLTKYLTSPGPSLRKILEGDTTIFQGQKPSDRNSAFMAARHDLLTPLFTSLKKRFIDMVSAVLHISWILDLKLWPAEYTGNEGFGDTTVGALAQSLEKTLSEAEVDPTKLETEWAVLKCYLYKVSKISPVSKLSWEQINESYREKCGSFLYFVDLLLSIPISSADAERGLSQVKLIKIDWRSRLTDDHLTDLLVVQLQSDIVSNFNPDEVVNRFLTTGAAVMMAITTHIAAAQRSISKGTLPRHIRESIFKHRDVIVTSWIDSSVRDPSQLLNVNKETLGVPFVGVAA
ncbi:hypothetical protein Hamer_G005770 [Homarus americanus]|uniref:Uncharacterized protein n=1 Tax=Homarus americanus TaxID=6706 RepID=A0A8J5JFQ8_HOMAM|nr:hypothetical protein Hamer_G005770 [Homarus americanus]